MRRGSDAPARGLARALACLFVFVLGSAAPARAEGTRLDDRAILGSADALHVDRIATRVTGFSQKGHGFQSQAGPLLGAGSESLTVLQVQGEAEAHQGDRITHRLTVPVDIVTSASANAADRYYGTPDTISTASAQNFSIDAGYELGVRASPTERVSGGLGVHHEENFRSWLFSLAYTKSLADDNATVGVSANEVFDWLDRYRLGGKRTGRTSRASTNLNLLVTQLLSASTVFGADYGITLQHGQLSNGWNTVPLENGQRVIERLPVARTRHAFGAGLAQWLPWNAALKLSYRLYLDDWDVAAHSVEAELRQRLFRWLVIGGNYRYHRQSAVEFFTARGRAEARYLTADSDLAKLVAQTVGGNLGFEMRVPGFGVSFVEFGYDRYFRSNDLSIDLFTCASGFRF